MKDDTIGELPPEAWVRPLVPLKRDDTSRAVETYPVLGFDTEYHSTTGELLCWQVFGADGGHVYTEPLTIEALAEAAVEHAGGRRRGDYWLVVYFSLAELQHLPVYTRASGLQEYARGSLDCTFTTRDGRTRLHVFDVGRFFDKEGLAQAAAAFGLEKLTWNRAAVSRRDLKRPGFYDYALRDAELCYRIAVEHLAPTFAREGASLFHRRTAGGVAAAVYRSKYLPAEVTAPPTFVRSLALRALWGGRAEAYARGDVGPVWEYDLASAYPRAAVALGLFPRGEDWRDWTPAAERRAIGGFVDAEFSFPARVRYPCLPVEHDDALLFPLQGRTRCTLAELRLARELGADVRVLQGFVYSTGDGSLAAFMRTMLERRERATGAERVAVKLFMNSLVGKLQQKTRNLGPRELERFAAALGVAIDDFRGMTRDDLVGLGAEPSRWIGSAWCPEWGALITGHTRARIGALAARLSPCYVATDALWIGRELRADELPADLALKRHGPAIVARTRLALIVGGAPKRAEKDASRDTDHVVYHAWAERDEAREALLEWEEERKYDTRRPLHFGEALRLEVPCGTWIMLRDRVGRLAWCQKRRLTEDGSSSPWTSAGAREAARISTNKRKGDDHGPRDEARRWRDHERAREHGRAAPDRGRARQARQGAGDARASRRPGPVARRAERR